MLTNTDGVHHQKSFKTSRRCKCKNHSHTPSTSEIKSDDSLGRKIMIPSGVEVKSLLKQHDPTLSQTRIKNMEERIHYFLSKVLTTNNNYKILKDGYHRICSSIMKKNLGIDDYYTIIKLLTNPENPIIESNDSYHSSNGNKNNGYCKGYRLANKYNTGNTRGIHLSKKFSDKIERRASIDQDNAFNDSYDFLTRQFEPDNITVDAGVMEYIKWVGEALLNRVEDDNLFQTNIIYNLIGRWLYYVNQINENHLWSRVSRKNHRLNSNISNFPRELRLYLRVDGKALGMIDISSSQPYILSSIININFFNDTSQGYNLYSIDPELYAMLVDEGYIKSNVSCSSGNTTNYYTSLSGTSTNITYKEESTHTPSPFMWSRFSNSDIESIHRYWSAPFKDDFYIDVLESYTHITGEVKDGPTVNMRQKLKDSMMYTLFVLASIKNVTTSG
jgi:hypothetical protein